MENKITAVQWLFDHVINYNGIVPTIKIIIAYKVPQLAAVFFLFDFQRVKK